MNKKQNFTLIELLIAISLFATIMVALYSALSVGIIAWKRGDKGSTRDQTARVVLNSIASDIKNCVYFSYIQFVGKTNEIYFPITSIVTDADKKSKGTFDTNIFKITYSLDRRSYRDSHKTLMRKKETFLQSLEPSRVKPKEFAPGVVKLSFHYSFAVPEEDQILDDTLPPFTWEDEWDVKNKIPMGVKIKLVLGDKDDPKNKNLTFEKIVFLPQGTLELPKKEEAME